MSNYGSRLRAALSVVTKHTKSIAFFRSKLIIDSFVTLFRVLVLMFLYMNIYKIAPTAGTILPYKSALWSMGAYFFAMAFTTRRLYSHLSKQIYSGEIELYLTRPLNVIVFNTARIMGEYLPQAIITGITVTAVLLLTIGAPDTISVFTIAVGGMLLSGGLIIELLIAGIIGLSAFWIENADPVYRILDKFILILGGSYVPVAFFPELLKKLSLYSPFGASRFVTYLFYPNIETMYGNYLLLQAAWIGILTFLLVIIYKKGHQSLSVNGS